VKVGKAKSLNQNYFWEMFSMAVSRGPHKFERITITFTPTADERSFRQVPSTFSVTERTYGWRTFEKIDYMIVPRRIASKEIKVDMFVDMRGKGTPGSLHKLVQSFVKEKLQTAWQGLKLAGIGKPIVADPPPQTFIRSTIEEMLGANLE
jgi:hypothetical protein